MMLRCICFVSLFVLGLSPAAQARPVSYPGGWTLMQMNNADYNTFHLHYSPTATYSIGLKSEYLRDRKAQAHSVQLNNLLKRWNTRDAQANLYLKSAFGFIEDGGDTDINAFTGIAADWETRRYFASYENRYRTNSGLGDGFEQTTRIGIAPYVAEYGGLHTWLMLQVDHMPEGEDTFTVTPLIRAFKGPYMVEGGMSNKGDVLLNWIVRF